MTRPHVVWLRVDLADHADPQEVVDAVNAGVLCAEEEDARRIVGWEWFYSAEKPARWNPYPDACSVVIDHTDEPRKGCEVCGETGRVPGSWLSCECCARRVFVGSFADCAAYIETAPRAVGWYDVIGANGEELEEYRRSIFEHREANAARIRRIDQKKETE